MSDQNTISVLADVDNYDVPVTTTDLASSVSGLSTVRAKILKLHADGLKTGQIAKILDKRYQHVRNELKNANLI